MDNIRHLKVRTIPCLAPHSQIRPGLTGGALRALSRNTARRKSPGKQALADSVAINVTVRTASCCSTVASPVSVAADCLIALRSKAVGPNEHGIQTVPYKSTEDLPESVRKRLPFHAQEIYRSAFNSAWFGYADRGMSEREEIAHRVAWAAVKRRYYRTPEGWIER